MKHRKSMLLVGLVAVLAALVVLAVPAFALPQYTTATSQACGVCHVSASGGGPLTPRGTAFAAVPTHFTDPAGAFTASGAASPAASPSPSPAASPSASASAKPAASPSASAAASPSASASAKPAASASASASASAAAGLPRTGGIPMLPFGLIAGFGLFALGWIARRFGR